MAFFLIVPSVMIVSIVLVHALSNRLGLKIYYTTLIAVAVLSVGADFAASMLAPAVGREYLLRLGLIILTASGIVTLANKFLIKRQRAEEERFTEEVKAAYAAEIQKNSQLTDSSPALDKIDARSLTAEAVDDSQAPTLAAETVDDSQAPTLAAEVVDDSQAPTLAAEVVDDSQASTLAAETVDDSQAPMLAAETVDDSQATTLATEAADDSDVIETVAPSESGKFPLDKVFKPLPEVKPVEADKPVELKETPDPADNFPLDEVFKPLPEIEREELKPIVNLDGKPKRAEFFPLQETFAPLSRLDLNKLEELNQSEKSAPHEPEDDIETLDDLLDRAYTERAKGHVWQAIALYKTALERYRNDEYAPFVVIDLGNLYRDRALYSKAIKIYEDALTLPAIRRNAEIRKEFVNNLHYLHVVRDVLGKHHAMSTPFAKLSREILQEIDMEFNKVQNKF